MCSMVWPCGGTGRRSGLKIRHSKECEGSNPSGATNFLCDSMKRQKKQRQPTYLSAITDTGVFLPVSGSSIVVEYPPSWPSEIRRITGTVKMINESTGNVYVWCDQTFQYVGINYRTGPRKGLKILIQETAGDDTGRSTGNN